MKHKKQEWLFYLWGRPSLRLIEDELKEPKKIFFLMLKKHTPLNT